MTMNLFYLIRTHNAKTRCRSSPTLPRTSEEYCGACHQQLRFRVLWTLTLKVWAKTSVTAMEVWITRTWNVPRVNSNITSEKEGEEMICCCNPYCHLGMWYHMTCVDNPSSEGNWYCSDECKETAARREDGMLDLEQSNKSITIPSSFSSLIC
jgi:hypothetical protein